MNNRSIPLMHTVSNSPYLSDQHSFTLHPSLSPYSRTESQTEKQIHLLCVGWRNLFSSCAVVSVFCSDGKQVLVVHTTMYLEYHTVVVMCEFFWFWREIVFGVMYGLSVQHSCAVVSVFLLWWES